MKYKLVVYTVLAIVALSLATKQTGPNRESGPQGNHHPTPNDISILEAKERKADHLAQETTQFIFDTIKEELDVRFAHGFGKGDKRCRVVTDDIEKKVYEGYGSAVDTYFDATFITQPEASSIIAKARALAWNGVKVVVAAIVDGIALIDEYYGDEVRMKIDKFEKECLEAAVNLMKIIYVPILKGHNSSTAIGAKLLRAEEKTVSASIVTIKGIFRGTRSVLAKVFPDIDFGVLDCSSFDVIENGTITGIRELVTHVYEAEDILFDVNLEKPKHTEWSPMN